MTWINLRHLASRTEFCVKTGPEFSEPHKTRIFQAGGDGGGRDEWDLKLIQISNTVIMPYITLKFWATVMFVTFDKQTVSNTIYGQFIYPSPI